MRNAIQTSGDGGGGVPMCSNFQTCLKGRIYIHGYAQFKRIININVNSEELGRVVASLSNTFGNWNTLERPPPVPGSLDCIAHCSCA